MRPCRVLPALMLTTLVLAVVGSVLVPPAVADPVPAPYAGSTGGAVVGVGVSGLSTPLATLLGLAGDVTATVAGSSTATDSTSTPRTAADSTNLAAGAVGLGSPSLASRHSEQPGGPDTDTGSLAAVPAAPVLSTGLLTGDTAANWAGDAACVPDGTPLASSTTTLASADVLHLGLSTLVPALPDLTVASLGTSSTAGRTELQPVGSTHDVVSTATGSLASLDLVGGAVHADVAGTATLKASSDGSTGSLTYTSPVVTVTAGGSTVGTLRNPGDTVTVPVPAISAAPLGTLTSQVTLTLGTPTDTSAGATGSGSLAAALAVDVSLDSTGLLQGLLGGAHLLDTHLGLLPLSASATAPAGGVECQLPPPVISSPTDGSWTAPRPTITGTGVPGATVHVVVDGGTAHDVTADTAGDWSYTPATALAPGTHDVVATQTLAGLTSVDSNHPHFRVPVTPVITAPADGSTVTDTTPDVSGTGEPGATLEAFVDGTSLGTTTVSPGGTWTLPVATALTPGAHTADATQSIGGVVLDAVQVRFTVLAAPATLPPPVVVDPADGSTTADPTPTIDGTGTPGATVTVVVDGTDVGTAAVDGTGSWSMDPATPLSCDSHTVSATQALGGLTSASSNLNTFTVTCTESGGATGSGTSSGGASSSGSSGGGLLPDTGAPAGLAGAAALGLLLLGTGTVAVRRRRAPAALLRSPGRHVAGRPA